MFKFSFSFNMRCIFKPREAHFEVHTCKVRTEK